jgi:outer membrane protein assembly factor BamB
MTFASTLLALALGLAAAGLPAVSLSAQVLDQTTLNEQLWDAARDGDVGRVKQALDRGADVNSGNRYKAGALFFAADKGHTDVIALLIDRGADVNAQDTFYRFRPIMMAVMNGHTDAAILLLQRGSGGAGPVLGQAAASGNRRLAAAALASKDLTRADVQAALAAARRGTDTETAGLLERRLADFPADPAVTIAREVLQSYTGTYRSDTSALTVALAGNRLTVTPPGQPTLSLVPTSQDAFDVAEAPGVSIAFSGRAGMVERMIVTTPGGTQGFARVTDTPAPAQTETSASSDATAIATPAPEMKPAVRTEPRPWPAFRGPNAAGHGDGQGAVTEWSVESGANIRWKTPIPGFATASPITWGQKVFVVTAVSARDDAEAKTFRTGLYGDVKPVDDLSEHTWKIYALDKASGQVLWERTAFTGAPKVKRHTKSTQANSTPATDGTHVVALFGSVGRLVAWDMAGRELWNVDIGVLDSGWFFDPTYQWGHSSSPIIHDGKVIVQADVQKGSFIAAYDVETGRRVWKTDRDEISTWGTPTVFNGLVVTNGPTVRAYDAATGREVWRLGPNSEVTVGTPVVGEGLVFVTGGYPPVRPIYAVRPTAAGDISLPKDATSSDAVAWSNTAGTYIPTPLFYDGILYTCSNEGIVTAYDAKTGERIYRARVGGGGAFSASPVAADGRLYFANEDGDVVVARAGRTYEELAKKHALDVAVTGDHPDHTTALFDEAHDFADGPAAHWRHEAERAIADRLQLDGVVEVGGLRVDDHQLLVQFDDVLVAAPPPVEAREPGPRGIPLHLRGRRPAAFATASPTVFINCVAMPPASSPARW